MWVRGENGLGAEFEGGGVSQIFWPCGGGAIKKIYILAGGARPLGSAGFFFGKKIFF